MKESALKFLKNLFISFSLLSLALPVYAAITQEEYHRVLNKVDSLYSPVFKYKGAEFLIQRSWDKKATTSMSKASKSGNARIIDMWGGYAKLEKATVDGFTAFTCHEIGHHLGGAPYTTHPNIPWSSTEAQADYFVTTKCLRFLWQNEDNLRAISKKDIHPLIERKCYEVYEQSSGQALCMRVANAGYEMLMALKGSFPKTISVDTPNTYPAKENFFNQHPGIQCRLDTLFQGALCPIPHYIDFGDQDDQGACMQTKYPEHGFRPRCWYVPRI